MFGSSCTAGCIQIPTPVYYWGPYAFPTTFGKKSFHIADIIQASQDYYKTSSGVGLALGTSRRPDPAHAASNKSSIRAYNPNTNNLDDTDNRSHRPSHSLSLGYNSQMTENGSESNEAINYSTKVVDKHIKCSVPSALEPLQALCSSELRGYDGFGVNNSKKRSTSVGEQSKVLKFGMSRILSDDFGKDDSKISDKENTKTFDALRPCECTYDGCHGYPSFRFPSHALSAVHALQPPKYPHGSGTDTLPGPYSVLNTEVNIGSQSKRKRSWSRAVFSNLQRKGLEKRFEVQKYVTKPDRRQLAAMLGLTDAQVKVWFQNRRMKWRHAQQCSQTESTDLEMGDQVNHDDAGNDVMQEPEVDRCEYLANQIDPSGVQTDDDSDSLDDIEEDMNIIVVNENEDSCANVTSDISNYSS